MTTLGRHCNADGCTLDATQVGALDLPPRGRVEVVLCDHHVDELRAGKVTQLRYDRRPDGGWGDTVVSFSR